MQRVVTQIEPPTDKLIINREKRRSCQFGAKPKNTYFSLLQNQPVNITDTNPNVTHNIETGLRPNLSAKPLNTGVPINVPIP
jgi:hypothetical protein